MDVSDLGGQPIGLTEKQLDAVRESTATYNVWEGAVASGKTIGSLYRWLVFIALTMDLPGELVMTGRTRDTVWRNCLLPMQSYFPGLVVGNLGAPTARIFGRLVHVIGASDVKAEQAIRGMTVLGAYVDEITTIQADYFRMLLTRLRVRGRRGKKLASKLFGTTNPDGPKHWLKADYFDNPTRMAEWRRFHFTLDDNPTLPEEFVRSMHTQYSGMWHRRFILGEWVAAEGAIWTSYDPDRHVVDPDLMPPMERILAVSIDYGTEHRTAGAVLGFAKERLWVLEEWAPEKGLAPSQYSSDFRGRFLPRVRRRWGDPEWVRVDPAARDFREQLFYDGVNNIAKASNAVVPGIRTVSSLFATNRLMISDTCTNLIDEIPGYVWDPKATERGTEAPVKDNDDFCDALRYVVHSTASEWRDLIPVFTNHDEVEAQEEGVGERLGP